MQNLFKIGCEVCIKYHKDEAIIFYQHPVFSKFIIL